MNILVTGGKGQLGLELQELSGDYDGYSFLFTDKEELDITSSGQVLSFFRKHKPDILINCAGYTDVEKAEDDIGTAMLVNAKGAGILAEACSKSSCLMIHVSTDYVFNGNKCKPYSETDSAGPGSVYGKSKLEGELEVIFNASRSVIIRTSWLYSVYGENFLKKILERAKKKEGLKVVFDQVGSPTYASDLARAIMEILPLIPTKARGVIYNYSNEGVCSWYDFARAVLEIAGLECDVEAVLSDSVKTRARRPHYSVLDKSRIKRDFGINVPYWRDSLALCLSRLTAFAR